MKRWGCELLAGGALWLAGVVLLESGIAVDSFAVRACFFVAGLLAGLGLWGLRTPLPSMVAKCGATVTAISVALVGAGWVLLGIAAIASHGIAADQAADSELLQPPRHSA